MSTNIQSQGQRAPLQNIFLQFFRNTLPYCIHPFLVSVSLFITLSSSFSCYFQHNIRRMTIIHRTNLANQLMRTSISRCTSVFVQSGLSNAFDFQSFYIYHINTSNHSNSFVQQTSSTINESRTRNIHHCAHQLQISLLRRSNTISSRLNLYL